MTDRGDHGRSEASLAAPPRQDGTSARRPRTAYRWYRRYRQLGRVALVAGGSFGLLVIGYTMLPLILAGEAVPRSSYLVAIALVAASALLPYALVRWRWQALRRQLEAD